MFGSPTGDEGGIFEEEMVGELPEETNKSRVEVVRDGEAIRAVVEAERFDDPEGRELQQ